MLLGHPVLQRRVGSSLGAIFGAKSMPKKLDLGVLGSIWAPFWSLLGVLGLLSMLLRVPCAPGPARVHFGCDFGNQMGAKSVQNAFKIDPKIYHISSSFLDESLIANWSQNGLEMPPNI